MSPEAADLGQSARDVLEVDLVGLRIVEVELVTRRRVHDVFASRARYAPELITVATGEALSPALLGEEGSEASRILVPTGRFRWARTQRVPLGCSNGNSPDNLGLESDHRTRDNAV